MLFDRFRNYLSAFSLSARIAPGKAYDQWAEDYDQQPGNLMIDLDLQVFSSLLSGIRVEARAIADIGCGTGRHWPRILCRHPSRLVGFDLSGKMLERLKVKFPLAETRLINEEKPLPAEDRSFDLIISTLTVAHIRNLDKALLEWDRLLKPGGDMLITDYHPALLEKGGQRTYCYRGKTRSIRNFIHPVSFLRDWAGKNGYSIPVFLERYIDEEVKPYYESQQALELYKRFRGTPVIYGLWLKKKE